VRTLGDRPAAGRGKLVLYWMTAQRRTRFNFALERSVDWARHLGKPLVVVEALGCGGRRASDRHHRFVLDGMAQNAADLADKPALYYPFVEQKPGEAAGLLRALAEGACVVVTDDFPLPDALDPGRTAAGLPARVERVDSNGLLPMAAAERDYPTAFALRRFLQRVLPEHLLDAPKARPLSRVKLRPIRSLPGEIRRRWAPATQRLLSGGAAELAGLPIDHGVPPAPLQGGMAAARRTLRNFLDRKLAGYAENRNHPDDDATSGLSPYLHHGHVSVHQVFSELAKREDWTPGHLAERASGKREGWWGMDEPAEAFLDELVTWRELGYNFCRHRDDFDRFDSLPPWAQTTLAAHAADRRQYVYTLDQFARAATHDPLWNAAQRQLVREGRMHNYLRMLWGKKILEWTAAPRDALEVMIELNNRYALDAPNPNTYSGILWTLGRYDRPWGPERPIFGKVRYMTSDNTARKVRVKGYLDKYTRQPEDCDA
jgi:deoxyribodipyrimidine photo-lyase